MPATLTVRKNEGPKYRYLKFKLDAKHKHLGATSEQIAMTLCDPSGRAYQLKGTDVIKLPPSPSSEPWAQTYPVLCSTHKSGNFILYINIEDDESEATRILRALPLKSKVMIDGPYGDVKYLGFGNFHFKDTAKSKNFRHLLIIAEGSGLTNMLTVLCSECQITNGELAMDVRV